MNSQASRTFVQWARLVGKPAALLFLDFRTAFYRIIREMLFNSNWEEALPHVLQLFAISPEAWHDALQWKGQHQSVLQAAHIGREVQEFTEALHANS